MKRSIADLVDWLSQHQILEESRNYSQSKSANVDKIVEDVLK